MDETPKYTYICSSGHSGSTLLDLLLGSHSQVFSLGEVSHLPKNLALNTPCTCGAPVRECPFWSKVVETFSRKWHDVSADPYAMNLGYARASRVVDPNRQTKWYLARRKALHGLAYSAYLRGHGAERIGDRILGASIAERKRLYEVVREVGGVPMLVDSSKCYLTGVGLYRSAPESVRILLLTRDGRGCVYSNVKRDVGVRRASLAWKNYYARALPLIERHVDPAHVHHVRYEDLAGDPAAELASICAFLGLEYEPKMIDYAAAEHHITNGNDMRFSAGSVIRGDYAWRKSLSPRDVSRFEKLAGSLNRRLGYE